MDEPVHHQRVKTIEITGWRWSKPERLSHVSIGCRYDESDAEILSENSVDNFGHGGTKFVSRQATLNDAPRSHEANR